MLATSSLGAPILDKQDDSGLSLIEVHALHDVVQILKHNYSYLVDDRD